MATRTGIIEVDSEGIPHCEDVMFIYAMSKYVGCRCSLTKYFENINESTKDKYPFFITYPDRINYSERGVVQEDEDGRLHVGKYLLPPTIPSGVTKGSIIDIEQIHPIYNKEIPFFGSITEYTLIDLEHREVRDSRVFFLLDTNTLIDCPTIFDRIDKDRPAIIESHVITELDGLKKAENVLTRNAAQQAHSQILEAQKQGKVKFATTRHPYLPFEEPASMDQKILAAAFLEEYLHSTVVLVSSDKNMLVLASSVHLQGVTLDDFLNGNYTIEAKEPIQEPQPEAKPNQRPEPGQNVLSIGPISPLSKFNQYKVNLEKDLERKYQEFSHLFTQLVHGTYGKLLEMDEEVCPPALVGLRRKIIAFLDTLSLSLLLFYDGIIHAMLFKNWSWQEDKAYFEESGLSYRNHSAEEIYNVLSRINIDAVCLLIDNLECPLGIKEQLQSSLSKKQKDVFVNKLNELTCDLSILHFYSDRISLLLGTIIGMFCDPQSVDDFFFHSDHGNLTDSFKEAITKRKKGSIDVENLNIDSISELIDSDIKHILRSTKVIIIDDMVDNVGYFPFEKKYVDRLLLNPDLQPYWERIKATQPNEKPAGQGEEVNVEFHFEVPSDVFDSQKRVVDDTIYVHSINPAVYTEPYSVETFQKLFDYVLKWGIIKDKADQGAMLTLLTGYYIQGAANNAKWCCDKYMPRVLYYIVKYLSKSSSKYESLESVDFYSDNIIIQDKIESDLYSIRKGSNTSQIVNNSIPVEIKRALHNLYPSLFIDTDEQ